MEGVAMLGTFALAVCFFLVAVLYSSVGHAGASGYLAVLAIASWLGVAVPDLKPTALALNLIVATAGAINFARAGHFSWRLFWPFAITSLPAAYAAGTVKLPEAVFKPLVGVVLLASAVRLVGTLRAAVTRDPVRPPLVIALAAGAALGALAGFTGTGGGIFLSPLILLMGWADVKRTAAVSVLFILVNSAAGLAGQWYAGTATLPPGLAVWGPAVLLGGALGSHLGSRRIDQPRLRLLLAAVLVVAGGGLIIEGGRAAAKATAVSGSPSSSR